MRPFVDVFGCSWSNQKRETGISQDIAFRGLQKKKRTRKEFFCLHYLSLAFIGETQTGQLHHTKEEHSVILSCLKLAVQL